MGLLADELWEETMSTQPSPMVAPIAMTGLHFQERNAWHALAIESRLPWDIVIPMGPANQKLGSDEEIFCEGEPADHCYRVVSGIVRTCKFFDDGRRQVDAFYVAGDFFGFESGAEYRHSAEAVTGCTIVGYRRKDIERVMADNVTFSQHFLGIALRNISRAQDHSLLLGRKTAHERVATFLKEWLIHSTNARTVMLAMTRQDIADYLGLTMETVSRTLSQMERDGVIEMVTPREISVKDRSALKRLVC
jgi:CRP/FNR family nitrogen fixation transcriptional regulator